MTKMKAQREAAKKEPQFKHTCGCMNDPEYLSELPESSTCVDPKYYERSGKSWVDVTEKVEQLW